MSRPEDLGARVAHRLRRHDLFNDSPKLGYFIEFCAAGSLRNARFCRFGKWSGGQYFRWKYYRVAVYTHLHLNYTIGNFACASTCLRASLRS